MAETVKNTTYICNQDILSTDLGDETVFMDVTDGSYYSLKGPSARVWQLLKDGLGFDEVLETLLLEFDVMRSVCEAELSTLVQSLVEKKIILPSES